MPPSPFYEQIPEAQRSDDCRFRYPDTSCLEELILELGHIDISLEYVQYTTLDTRYPRYGNSVLHEIRTYHSIWRVQQAKPSHYFWFIDDWTCFFIAWETEQATESWWYSCQCWLLSQSLSKSYGETLWQPFLWQGRPKRTIFSRWLTSGITAIHKQNTAALSFLPCSHATHHVRLSTLLFIV